MHTRASVAAAHTVPSDAELRRIHDLNAYAAAKAEAGAAARKLLAALMADLPAAEMAPAARSALRSVGLLWETAARTVE